MIRPSVVRRIIYPTQERILSRPTFSYLKDLEATQWLSRKEIEELQAKKLSTLLRIAREHSPWHRARIEEAGLSERATITLEELKKLPTMDKRDAAAHGGKMVWRGAPGGVFPYNTGGSSGEPLTFYYGRRRQASDAAGRMRARKWWGVDPGDPEVYLWGAPVELNKTDRIKSLRDRLLNQLVLNAFDMSPEHMDEYLEAIKSYQPRCIYGYASSVALLAAHAQARQTEMKSTSLKVVCTTGEPLFEHQRTLIEMVFGVPVANEFGSRDIGFTAHESPEHQLLLMSESIILEVLDNRGAPVASGETGEAVLTGLESFAQAFIRYRTGDMISVSKEMCKAGRGLHVLGAVVGRTTDFLVRSDGTIMHALAAIYVLRAIPGVAEFKIIQETVRDLRVLVVPNERWQEADGSAIQEGLRKRLGADVRVAVAREEHIHPEVSGKYRYVVSRVPLGGELSVATALQGGAE